MPKSKRTGQRVGVTEFFQRRSKGLLAAIAMLLFVLVSLLKFLSGPEFVFSAVYLVPISFTTWCLSVAAGLGMAVASAFLLLLVNLSEAHKYVHAIVPYWNAMMDLAVFFIVILILAEAKSLYRRERELSREDFLTGLSNGRAFREALTTEITRVRRYPHQITIVYIDLDNFKQVNDSYGHHEGDLLLTVIADALRTTVREVDVVARLGGDEFGVLLPETDANAAGMLLSKIQGTLVEAVANHQPQPDVSFSAGAVTFAKPLESVEEMIRYADRLMYSVKQNGKGRVLQEVVG